MITRRSFFKYLTLPLSLPFLAPLLKVSNVKDVPLPQKNMQAGEVANIIDLDGPMYMRVVLTEVTASKNAKIQISDNGEDWRDG